MRSYHEFYTLDEALGYRHENNTGGWIFAPDQGRPVYLFPPDMPPIDIFHHPLTKGKSGKLLSNA